MSHYERYVNAARTLFGDHGYNLIGAAKGFLVMPRKIGWYTPPPLAAGPFKSITSAIDRYIPLIADPTFTSRAIRLSMGAN